MMHKVLWIPVLVLSSDSSIRFVKMMLVPPASSRLEAFGTRTRYQVPVTGTGTRYLVPGTRTLYR